MLDLEKNVSFIKIWPEQFVIRKSCHAVFVMIYSPGFKWQSQKFEAYSITKLQKIKHLNVKSSPFFKAKKNMYYIKKLNIKLAQKILNVI